MAAMFLNRGHLMTENVTASEILLRGCFVKRMFSKRMFCQEDA